MLTDGGIEIAHGKEPFVPTLTLFHDRREFERHCAQMCGTPFESVRSEAQTFYANGEAAVLFDARSDTSDEHALLAHEAYHAVMGNLAALGESEPGEETVACMLQYATYALIDAHERWKHAGDGEEQRAERDCGHTGGRP